MNILSRIRAGWRGFWIGDRYDSEQWIPLSGAGGAGEFGGSHPGEEKYLVISAYFASLRNISEDIGKLPFILYERNGRDKERAIDHKYYSLIRYRPAQPITSGALRETLIRYALAWGNGYARIYRKNNGDVGLIQPIPSKYVTPKGDGDGGLEYLIKKTNKNPETVPGENMIHIHGVGSNGVTGMSIAAHAFQSMTMAGAIRRFGTNMYTTNGRPGGYLKTAAKLSPEARNANVEAWKKAHAGDKMGGTAMVDNGLEYKQVTVNPTDAQFLETCQYTIEDVARWFRMPLHKIQYLLRAQGWSTLDAQNTDYLTDTLLPWLTRIEEEFTYKIFGGHDKYFCEHLVDSILRADIKTRTEAYMRQFSMGGLTINEMRAAENRNPMKGKGGDTHFIPMNMTPAEFVNSHTIKDDSTDQNNSTEKEGE